MPPPFPCASQQQRLQGRSLLHAPSPRLTHPERPPPRIFRSNEKYLECTHLPSFLPVGSRVGLPPPPFLPPPSMSRTEHVILASLPAPPPTSFPPPLTHTKLPFLYPLRSALMLFSPPPPPPPLPHPSHAWFVFWYMRLQRRMSFVAPALRYPFPFSNNPSYPIPKRSFIFCSSIFFLCLFMFRRTGCYKQQQTIEGRYNIILLRSG